MTNNIDREIYYVQNPAIGAAALWQFICGYYSKESKAIPFPLLFIVLPILLREDLCTVIKSTQKKKGLSKVSEKLFKDKKNDDLYTINKSAIETYYDIIRFLVRLIAVISMVFRAVRSG